MTDTTPVPTDWLNKLYSEFKRLGDSRQSMHMMQVCAIRDQLSVLLHKDPEHVNTLTEFATWMDNQPGLDAAYYEPAELVQMYLMSKIGSPDDKATPPPVPELPHSRACGLSKHDHGTACHSNCPTCGGREFRL